MTLLNYWPTEQEVGRCIKTEAETASEAVLLAVHQPTPLSRRVVGQVVAESSSEEEFFSYFASPDVPSGALVAPVTGSSGVGKSHLIRWLDAKLRELPDADRHLVIRIPKSASLRDVIEAILAPLPDDQYGLVKQEYRKAVADVNPADAAIRFRGELQIALRQLEAHFEAQARAMPGETLLREQLGHARKLPALLNDPVTAPHYEQQVLPRILQRALVGREEGEEDDTLGHFTPSDLVLPETVESTEAATQVHQYYKTLIMYDRRGCTSAAEVLNKVVDEATRQLFQLSSNLGGMTFEDVILAIRRQLLAEGRELVLLVEDFVALTGIQEILLKVLIREGIRDGVQQLATMRSAIAVTEGYLSNRETILTRAHFEWIVESRFDTDAEVLGRTKGMVASYLNAARWGETKLKAFLSMAAGQALDRGNKWLPAFTVEELPQSEQQQLSSFGIVNEVPLFPFTECAIDYLAKSGLKEGERLVFNPRFIINGILRKVLQHNRKQFADRQFPSADLSREPPSQAIASWLSSHSLAPDVRKRLEAVVTIWGDKPRLLSEIAAIPSAVFEAFGLKRPLLPDVSPTVRSPRPGHQASLAPSAVPAARVAQDLERWSAALEDWIAGKVMPQEIVRFIRPRVAKALNARIDWNAERLNVNPVPPGWIEVPNAKTGTAASGPKIPIADDPTDPDGRVRAALVALYRYFELYKKNADYPEGDDDLVHISNFVDGLLPVALAAVRGVAERELQSDLAAYRETGRLIGVVANKAGTPRAAAQLLRPVEPAALPTPEGMPEAVRRWQEVQQRISDVRPSLLAAIIDRCGCFQGTGKQPYAIDVVRVANMLGKAEVEVDLLPSDVQQPYREVSPGRIAPRLRNFTEEVLKMAALVAQELGRDFDKDAVVASFKRLAELLREKGHWPQSKVGCTASEYLNIVEGFRKAAVKDAIEAAQRLAELKVVEEAGAQVERVVQVPVSHLLTAERFVTATRSLLESVERRLESDAVTQAGANPERVRAQLRELLNELAVGLGALESEYV